MEQFYLLYKTIVRLVPNPCSGKFFSPCYVNTYHSQCFFSKWGSQLVMLKKKESFIGLYKC